MAASVTRERAVARQARATDKGKPQEYLMYAEKIEFTQKMWTLAHLVANMKRAASCRSAERLRRPHALRHRLDF